MNLPHLPHCARGGKAARLAMAAAFALSLFLPAPYMSEAEAEETVTVLKQDGTPLFELHFFSKGEAIDEDEGGAFLSTWTLSDAQKNAVTSAVALWAEVVGPGSANSTPLPFHIGTYDVGNAEAASEANASSLPVLVTGVQGGIIHGTAMDNPAYILVGRLDFGIPEHLSPLPSTGAQTDLVSVLYHETAHALGVLSFMQTGKNEQFSLWDTHLKDAYGTRLTPGMNVVHEGEGGVPGRDFIVGDATRSGVTFHGRNVAEVMGNDGGLLIEGYEDDYLDLSHIELEHSLMSHQNYRNYSTFMEAELAVLQDLGYSIDRRNFYGFSVYGDDSVIINENGYFARNEEGNGFLYGVPNTATLGVGLHVYGKRNTITQAADLLACGTAGTGIRVDGSGNTLTLAPGVRVAADGAWGTGILLSYGKNHTVVSRGDVTATGMGGVAARFDFGDNLLGNATEYRGSWIWNNPYEEWGWNLVSDPSDPYYNIDPYDMELNLDGPLVSSFDVSGLLAGSAASIFVSENAFVENINILSGAHIVGDIVSEWDPQNPDIQYPGDPGELHTALTFGRSARADGTAGEADPDFAMTLYGGIDGKKSLDMSLEAGRLAVTDTVNVYSLRNGGRLALYGADEEGFGADVADAFVNEEGAVLETGFLPTGAVNGVKAYSAVLDGTWALRPMPGFYAQNAPVTPQAPVQAEYVSGGFTDVTLGPDLSPTLDFTLSFEPGLTIIPTREQDAYSRFAGNAGAASLGRALYGISGAAEGDMQALLAALDWSEPDGTTVARGLNLLSPEAFDASARAALNRMSSLNALLFQLMQAPSTEGWSMRLVPYGEGSRQDAHGGFSGWESRSAGFLAAMERGFASGITAGAHLAADTGRTRLDGDRARSDSHSVFLGGQARLAPEAWNGFHLSAQARLGLESADMERNLAFNGYARHAESDWTGLGAGFMLGAGRDVTWETSAGSFTAGPLAWLEYSLLRREGITEHGGGAASLHMDGEYYDSLPLSLGAHLAWSGKGENGAGMGLNLTAAWRHELADDTFHTHAHFAGYDGFGFSSSTTLPGRDALFLQASLRLTSPDQAFFMNLSAGGEAFRTAASSLHAGFSLGWRF